MLTPLSNYRCDFCLSLSHASSSLAPRSSITLTEHRTKNKMNWAEDQLWCLRQGGRPLEGYVEEFIELSYLVSWPDSSLCACFQLGLDENTIHCSSPMCDFSLVELINLILHLNGSNFEVEVRKDKSHSENHWASPARPRPASSTFLANGSDHPYPPVSPRARRWASKSTGMHLGAKGVDPAFTSVRTVLNVSVSNSQVPSSPQPRNAGRSTVKPTGRFTSKP